MSHAYYIHLNLYLHVMIQKEPKNKIVSEEARLTCDINYEHFKNLQK